MALTLDQISALPSSQRAYVLEFQGYNYAATTSNELVTATWGGDWTNLKPTLQMPSALSREIDLINFKLNASPWTAQIVDADGSLALIMAEAYQSANVTLMKENTAIDRNDTPITVLDTTGFANSGTIYFGHEASTYASKTGTTFAGLTRGKFPFAGKSAWGLPFDTKQDEPGVEVSDYPRAWYRRGVMIYLTAKDPTTGTWLPKSSARLVFCGRINGWTRDGATGIWNFDLVSVEDDILRKEVFRDQWSATVKEGFHLNAETLQFVEGVHYGSTTVVNWASFSLAAGVYTNTTLMDAIESGIRGATPAPAYSWRLSNVTQGDGSNRTRLLVVTGTIGAGSEDVNIRMNLYGYDADSGEKRQSPALQRLGFKNGSAEAEADEFSTSSTTKAVAISDGPPVRAMFSWSTTIPVDNEQGTWQNQPSGSAVDVPGFTGEGFVMVDGGLHSGKILGVNYAAGSLTRVGTYDLGGQYNPLAPADDTVLGINVGPWPFVIYVGDDENKTIRVKQVWVAQGFLHRVLGRLLLSSGVTDYNDATYDKWPDDVGIGLPSTIVDMNSIVAVQQRRNMVCTLLIHQRQNAAEIVEGLMQQYGFHLTWRNAKLTAVTPTTMPANATVNWTLNANNTGSNWYTTARDGGSHITNKVTLKYNYDPVEEKYKDTLELNETVSQGIYGVRSSTYECPNLYDTDLSRVKAWADGTGADIIAFFGNAMRLLTRSIGPSLASASVGDIVALTDDDAPNQTTGDYGYNATRAWIVAHSYDPATCEGQVTLLIPPTVQSWAPTGMLDYSRGDFGYDSLGPYLHLRDHEFSLSGEAVDASNFAQNDVIRIFAIDDGQTTTTWSRTITAISGSRLTLSSTLSSPAFDSAKRYYVTYDIYANATTAQKAIGVWVGDDSDGKINATDKNQLWGANKADNDETDTVVVPTRRFKDTRGLTDEGYSLGPWFLRDMADFVNNAVAYITNQHPISYGFTTYVTSSSNSYELIRMWLVRCPPQATTLRYRMLVQGPGGADTASWRWTATATMPTGAGTGPNALTMTFPNDKNQATSTRTANTYDWVEGTLTVLPGPDGNCYVTLEAKNDAAAPTNGDRLRIVSAWFDPIDVTV